MNRTITPDPSVKTFRNYIYIWVNYNDLTVLPHWKSWLIREIIPKWPEFRFVNYYNLPRCTMMYTHFIPLSHYMWLYVLHIFCTWLHIYNMHAFLICILYIRWMGSFTLGFVASLIVISKKQTKKTGIYLVVQFQFQVGYLSRVIIEGSLEF